MGSRWLPYGLAGLAVLAGSSVAVALRMGAEARRAAGDPPAHTSSPTGVSAVLPTPAPEPTPAAPAVPAPEPVPPAAAAPRSFDVVVSVHPPQAAIALDGIAVGQGSYRTTLQADGTPHTITAQAEGYEAVDIQFTDQPPPKYLDLKARSPAPRATRGRPVRRAPAPPSRAQNEPRSRGGGGDEWSWSENPDPWAADSRRREADKPTEVAQ